MRAIKMLLYALINNLAKIAKYLSNHSVIFFALISIYLLLAFNGTLSDLLNTHTILDKSQMEVSFYAPLICLSGMCLALSLKSLLINLNTINEKRKVSEFNVASIVLMSTILSISFFKIYPHITLIPDERHDAITLLISMSFLFAAWAVQIQRNSCTVHAEDGNHIIFFVREKKAIHQQTLNKITNSICGSYVVVAFTLFMIMLFHDL